MSNNRVIADLAQTLSASSGGSIKVNNGSLIGDTLTDSDYGGVAVSGFTDSSEVATVITTGYISQQTGKAASTAGARAHFQGSLGTSFNPLASATYNIGDSASPIDEIILDSSASIYFGGLSMTALLMSGTSANVSSGAAGAAAAWYGDRAVLGGGVSAAGYINEIEYYDLTTAGNASDFGDLTNLGGLGAAVSNKTRVAFVGGSNRINVIDYITVATTSNASDFGACTYLNGRRHGASDGSRGIIMGSTNNINVEYITIATTGNGTDFGDLITPFWMSGDGGSDATYGIFGSGNVTAFSNTMEYFTIATTGNATDFGDLTTACRMVAMMSDATRTVSGGGQVDGGYSNVIDYITTATPSNATDFGDLTNALFDISGTSNGTYGTFAGGKSQTIASTNQIQVLTFQTTSNTTDFGDLTNNKYAMMGSSGSPS